MESTWRVVHDLHEQHPELVKELVTLYWGEHGYELFRTCPNTSQFALSLHKPLSNTANRVNRIPGDLQDMLVARQISPDLSLYTYRKLYRGKVKTEEDIFLQLAKADVSVRIGSAHCVEIVNTLHSADLFDKYQERILTNYRLPVTLRRDINDKFSMYKLPDTTETNLRFILPIWGQQELNPVDKSILLLEEGDVNTVASLACTSVLLQFHETQWVPEEFEDLMSKIATGAVKNHAAVGVQLGVTRQRGHSKVKLLHECVLRNLRNEACVGLSNQTYRFVKEAHPRNILTWKSLIQNTSVPGEIRKELFDYILKKTLPDW